MNPRLSHPFNLLLIIGVLCLPISCQGATTKLVSAHISTVQPGASGETSAITITDSKTLATLESFFPAYRTARSSRAGAWIARHEIIFHFSDGSTTRVTTADDHEVWSNGHGDIPTRGNFTAFVKSLQTQTSTSNPGKADTPKTNASR